MEKTALNYRIIIEPEPDPKTGKLVYNALSPALGVADWGNTIEQSLEHIKGAIECHIEALTKHGESIPEPDGKKDFMVASTHISLPKNIQPSFV